MNLIKQLSFWLLVSLSIVVVVPVSGFQKPLKEKENPIFVGERDINKRQINIYSLEKELELGKLLAAELEKRVELVNEPRLLELVNRVTQNIAINSDTKLLVTAKVINSTDINAFSLPGGFLYVNRGLIEAADNEAELAGVIAHEVAHIAARHSIEKTSRRDLVRWVTRSFDLFGDGSNPIDQAAGVFTFKFSRDAEKEADLLATQYLWKADYDPQALITFLERLKPGEKKSRIPLQNRFRTHPLSKDRIKDTRELLARFPKKNEYRLNSSDFIALKASPEIKDEAAVPDSNKERRIPGVKRRRRTPVPVNGPGQPGRPGGPAGRRPSTIPQRPLTVDSL